jgi:type I restriction enzyme, S subunit
MAKTKKTPELRFKGFVEEWEENKIGNLGEIVTGSTPATGNKSYYTGDLLFVSPADIQGGRYIETTITTLSEKGFLQGRVIEADSILFVCIGSTIGKVAQLRKKAITNQQINSIIPTTGSNHDFIFSLLANKSKKIQQLAATQAVPIINKTSFSNINVHIPKNIGEQNQIGSYFQNLDALIALHQHKHDKFLAVKKAMLEKMFPKEGADVPEIRFKGFEGRWERRKYCKTFTILSNNTLSRADLNYCIGMVKNIHYGDVLIKFGELVDIKKATIPFITDVNCAEELRPSLLKNGDLIIADTAEDETVGKCTELINMNSESVVSGLHTIPSRPILPFALGYLGYFMNSFAYHDQLLGLMQGTKVLSISKTILQDTNIYFPNAMDEQTKIAAFFQHLDSLISLHQRELDKLKNIKKACLEKMFV